MDVCNRFHNMQTETCTGTASIRIRKSFKQPRPLFKRDPPALIRNTDDGRIFLQLDKHRCATGRIFYGILDQIADCVLYRRGIAVNYDGARE